MNRGARGEEDDALRFYSRMGYGEGAWLTISARRLVIPLCGPYGCWTAIHDGLLRAYLYRAYPKIRRN